MSSWNKLTTVTYDGSGEISFNTTKLGNFAVSKSAAPAPNYLCFTAEEAADIKWKINGSISKKPSIQYSLNDVNNWQEYTLGTNITLTANQKCYWKGTTNTFSVGTLNYIQFSSTGRVAASGEVDSLINWAPLTSYCYRSMFDGCTLLTAAPVLPATTLANNCYSQMFRNCSSITTAPALPATILAKDCYQAMFRKCTSLTAAPALPATTLAISCYSDMFNGCTSITTAPVLPATTLANDCYLQMFYGCLSLYVSNTSGEGYDKEWRIPTTGTFTNAYDQLDIFAQCAGTRSSSSWFGTQGKSYVYYTQNTPV